MQKIFAMFTVMALMLQACMTTRYAADAGEWSGEDEIIVHKINGDRILFRPGEWSVDEEGDISGSGNVLGALSRPFQGTIPIGNIARVETKRTDAVLTGIAVFLVGGIALGIAVSQVGVLQ